MNTAACTNCATDAAEAAREPLLRVAGVSKVFPLPRTLLKARKTLAAVNDVSLRLEEGEVLGIVGESGCGKSTLAKMILGILSPTEGSIEIQGRSLQSYGHKERALLMQPVFQDPYSSLNPRRKVKDIIRQPLDLHRIGTADERDSAVDEMINVVGLPRRTKTAYPSQLSGGQRQRVAIARALVLHPRLVVCDEPTSALDVSVQAQIINLLMDLRRDFRVAILFISHNLAVVRHISDNIAVMKAGCVVEYGCTPNIFERPTHEYTRALLSSILTLPTVTDACPDPSARRAEH